MRLEVEVSGDLASVFVVEWSEATLEACQIYLFPVLFEYVVVPVAVALLPWRREPESRSLRPRRLL